MSKKKAKVKVTYLAGTTVGGADEPSSSSDEFFVLAWLLQHRALYFDAVAGD